VTNFRRFVPLALLIGTAAHAQGFEDLAALDRKVAAALGADAGEPGGPARPIDKRLKLAACPQPAIVDAPAMGAVLVRCEPLGWRIRVALARPAGGSALAAAEKAEPIIRKGDQVQLTALTGSFSVSTTAVAEQDGAPGDRIRVRSETKKGAVIGMVMPDGRVALPGFK
jgi:flagellar basal body P-ring formation protein FlgA